MDTQPTKAQPTGQDDMGENEEAVKGMAPKDSNSSPLAVSALRRQTPEVGAVCGNPARTVLCGGTGVTRFPTAITYPAQRGAQRERRLRRVGGLPGHGRTPVSRSATSFFTAASTWSKPISSPGS